MKKKTVLIIIGMILIGLQILSIMGRNKFNTKLFDDSSIFSIPYISLKESGLNFSKWLFGFEAGADKFTTSLSDLFSEEEYWRPGTTDEMTSVMIRESLGSNSDNPSIALFLYDANISIAYWACGVLGIILVVCGLRTKE